MIGWLIFATIALLLSHYFHWILDLIDISAFWLGLLFLFLCIFRKTRSFSATALIYCSSVLAITMWVYLLSNTYGAFGFWGVFVGILLAGIGIYLTGLVALLWVHQLAWFAWFVVEIIFILVIRIAGTYIAQKELERQNREQEVLLFGSEPEEDESVTVEETPKRKMYHTPSPVAAFQTPAAEKNLIDFLKMTGQISQSEKALDSIAPSVEKICSCDEPQCAKCLGGNCHGKDCSIHTTENKAQCRQNWERSHKRPYPQTF